MLVVLGMFDDVFRLNAVLKFLVQIAAAVIAVLNGVVIDNISIGGHYYVFGVWSIPISVLWIVGLTNAINLIDGWTDFPAECLPFARPLFSASCSSWEIRKRRSSWLCLRRPASALCRSTRIPRKSSWATPARCFSDILWR